MDQIFLDKANHCLEIFGVSGIINVHLDNDSPVCLSFCQKVKIYFDINKPSQTQRSALHAALDSAPPSAVVRSEEQPDLTQKHLESNNVSNPLRLNELKGTVPSLVLDLEKHCVYTIKEEKVDADYEINKDDGNYETHEDNQGAPLMLVKNHHNPDEFSLKVVDQPRHIATHHQTTKSPNKRKNGRAQKDQVGSEPGEQPDNAEAKELEKEDYKTSLSLVVQSRQRLWPIDNIKMPAAHTATNSKEVLKVLKKECLSHERENPHDPEYLCLFCNTSFLTNFHLAAHHRLAECIKRCQKCSEEFLCDADLFIHEHAEHSYNFVVSRYPSYDVLHVSECGSNQCPLCGLKLANDRSHHHHVQHVHFSEKTFNCCVCGHREKGHADLLIHLRRHSNNRILAVEESRKRGPSPKENKGEAKSAKLHLKAKRAASQESCKKTLKPAVAVSKKVTSPSVPPNKKEKTCKPCTLCGRVFKTLENKKEHTVIPVEETKCSKCHLSFSSQAELIVHEYRDHAVVDGDVVIDRSKLGDQKNKALTHCPLCSKQSLKASVVEHVSEVHTQEMRYKCCVCTDKFTCRRLLLKHCRSHMNPDKFRKGLIRCSLCPEIFTTRGEHSKHILNIHSTVCVFCQKDLGHKLLLDIHYKEEHADRLFTCDVCGKQVPTENRLTTHKRWHRFRKSHPCPVCGKLIRDVQSHIECFHPDYEKEKCDSTESREDQRIGDFHLLMSESEGGFNTLDSNNPLHAAVSNNHIFLCSLCPTTFPRRKLLERHLKKHESKERVPCPQCGKTFANRMQLTRHLEAIHIKSKVYTCHVCGKQCNKKSNLGVHMRTHMLNKVFSCKMCNQGFNYRASLKNHMRSKHNTELTDN